jgi:hypothetical protein
LGRIGRALAALLAFAAATGAAAAEPAIVTYPRSFSPNDSQYVYDYELLHLALAKTAERHGRVELRESAAAMNQARAEEEITSGTGAVQVFARSTTIEHEARMLPVRIPLDKGLVAIALPDPGRGPAAVQPRCARSTTCGSSAPGPFDTWADTASCATPGSRW